MLGADTPLSPVKPDLPRPTPSMTPKERGRLLCTYIRRRQSLAGLDFRNAHVAECALRGAKLDNADLTGARFVSVDLRGSKCHNTTFLGVAWYRSNLAGASVRGADFRRGRLVECNLSGVDVGQAQVQELLVDRDTYETSGWTPAFLTSLRKRKVAICGFEEGLTPIKLARLDLSFGHALDPEDRVALDGVVAAFMGANPEADLELSHDIGPDRATKVRLTAADPHHLEEVASLLYRGYFLRRESTPIPALARQVSRTLGPRTCRQLSLLLDFGDGMELWMADAEGRVQQHQTWTPTDTPDQAHARLLRSLFDRPTLEMFLRLTLQEDADMIDLGGSLAVACGNVVFALHRLGRLNLTWFGALIQHAPDRKSDIARIAGGYPLPKLEQK